MSKTPKPITATENRLPDRFSRASTPIGIIARDPKMFRSIVDAFEACDSKLFHHLLSELKVSEACERICVWLSSKETVLECLRICGPPPQEPITFEHVSRFADLVADLSQDEFLLRRLIDAVKDRDSVAFKTIVKELGAEQLCHLLCHWISVVRYRLICEIVCGKKEVQPYQVVAELTRAGEAVGQLAKKRVMLRSAYESAIAYDADSLGDIIGVFVECYLICEWFCSWRCVRICLLSCRSFPIPEVKDHVDEMRDFALFSEKLAENKEAFARILPAIQSGNTETYSALISEFKAERYCLQICHWICYELCLRWCRVHCIPNLPGAEPLFTSVGHFNIYSDIDSSSGLTNKKLSFASLSNGGGPNFAFFGQLPLNGYCPSTSPTSIGTPMKYRFLYAIGSGTPAPITGPLLSPVENFRRIPWPEQDMSGKALSTTTLMTQSVIIQFAPGGILPPDPTPPAPGTTWIAPSPHYITADPNGWIEVDLNAVGLGFSQLLGFDTTRVVNGGTPPQPGAGNPVPVPQQKGGTDLSIIFEATRTSTLPPGTTPDYSNTLSKIRINNWNEVNQLDFVEFATGCCTPIANALNVLYTVDHEQLGAGEWSLSITSCSKTAPGDITPAGLPLTYRGGSGSIYENTTTWEYCSYSVTLMTRPGLTTGLVDRSGWYVTKTFCKCGP